MPGGKGNIRPEDGKQFSSEYQPDKEIWTEEKSKEFFNELIDWFFKEDENIFLNDFFYFEYMPNHKEIKRESYGDLPTYLKNKFTSCAKLYDVSLKMQETKLIKFSVFDKLNATMTKFTLINNHNWKDKSETDITSKGERIIPQSPEEREKEIQELIKKAQKK